MGNCTCFTKKTQPNAYGPGSRQPAERESPGLKAKNLSGTEACSNVHMESRGSLRQQANGLLSTQNGISLGQPVDESKPKDTMGEMVIEDRKGGGQSGVNQGLQLNCSRVNIRVQVGKSEESSILPPEEPPEDNGRGLLDVPGRLNSQNLLSNRRMENSRAISWMGESKNELIEKTRATERPIIVGMPVVRQIQLQPNGWAGRSQQQFGGSNSKATPNNPYIERSYAGESVGKGEKQGASGGERGGRGRMGEGEQCSEKVNEQPNEYPISGMIWQSKIM